MYVLKYLNIFLKQRATYGYVSSKRSANGDCKFTIVFEGKSLAVVGFSTY